MRVFKSQLIRDQLTPSELAALEQDFRTYKSSRCTPSSFGRDVLYDHPHTPRILLAEEVRHIHLRFDNGWQTRLLQFDRKSDDHLVYCEGALEPDVFLLMAVLRPNAHDLINDLTTAIKLGEMAERFRQQF